MLVLKWSVVNQACRQYFAVLRPFQQLSSWPSKPSLISVVQHYIYLKAAPPDPKNVSLLERPHNINFVYKVFFTKVKQLHTDDLEDYISIK